MTAPADRCHCAGYTLPDVERELRIHGQHYCSVYAEKRTGDIEVHSVLDDGAGELVMSFGDDETAAAENLLDEIHKLRDEALASRALLREVVDAVHGTTAVSLDLAGRLRSHLAGKP
jgi:hypothetical protein